MPKRKALWPLLPVFRNIQICKKDLQVDPIATITLCFYKSKYKIRGEISLKRKSHRQIPKVRG